MLRGLVRNLNLHPFLFKQSGIHEGDMKNKNGRFIFTEKLDVIVVAWMSEKPFLFTSLFLSSQGFTKAI